MEEGNSYTFLHHMISVVLIEVHVSVFLNVHSTLYIPDTIPALLHDNKYENRNQCESCAHYIENVMIHDDTAFCV